MAETSKSSDHVALSGRRRRGVNALICLVVTLAMLAISGTQTGIRLELSASDKPIVSNYRTGGTPRCGHRP